MDIKIEAPIGKKVVWTDEDIEQLKDALRSANNTCRSAAQIAKRKGERTNWTAFTSKLDASLKHQHLVMKLLGMFGKRGPKNKSV